MTRGVEVALIPVFQFGVFSDSDLSYFAGPPFAFQGRVHTNGNLFLAANTGPLILDAKTTAVGEIIRDRLANNYSSAGAYPGRCVCAQRNRWMRSAESDRKCQLFEVHDSIGQLERRNSARGHADQSDNVDQHFDADFQEFHRQRHVAGSAAADASFRAGSERRGAADPDHPEGSAGRAPTSSTGSSREFNKANIRMLLASTEADLVPDRPALIGDPDNVNLDNGCVGGRTDVVTGVGVTPWAMAKTGTGL